MCPLSSLHTSNFRRRAAFDLRPGGQTGPGVNCLQGLLALTPRPQGARGTPTPNCALTSPPGSPSPASQGLAFPPPSRVRNLVNENTTTGTRPLQVLRNLRASWEAPRQAGAGAGPGGVGVMGGPCLTGPRPPPAQAQARGRLAPRGQHRLAGRSGLPDGQAVVRGCSSVKFCLCSQLRTSQRGCARPPHPRAPC